MHFEYRYKPMMRQIHVRIFCGPDESSMLPIGMLRVDPDQFNAYVEILEAARVGLQNGDTGSSDHEIKILEVASLYYGN